jgi:hypothetical protein
MTEEERYVYWKNQIQEQKDSDLSINAFCKKQKIGYSTFYNWSRKVKERFNTAFLEIKDTEVPENRELKLSCGNIELRINNNLPLEDLSKLIKALDQASRMT